VHLFTDKLDWKNVICLLYRQRFCELCFEGHLEDAPNVLRVGFLCTYLSMYKLISIHFNKTLSKFIGQSVYRALELLNSFSLHKTLSGD